MAYAAVITLKVFAEELLATYNPYFSPPSIQLLEFAQKEVKSFLEYLNRLDGSSRERMDASLRRIAESTRKLIDVLLSHVKDQMESQYLYVLNGMLIEVEVESIKQEFDVIFETMNVVKKERFNGGNKSKRVGLSDTYNKLKQDMLVDLMELKIRYFSIVGMAGIGKTSIAEAIFNDLDVLEWFECCVWVSVGKNCQLEEIQRRIVAQLDPDSGRKLAEGDGDIVSYLEESLKGKRYLIVLDDVWDTGVCPYLGSFLPITKEGCRVILTCRSRRVVEEARFTIEMRLLNEKESWALLREKVFGEKSCPLELEKVGKKIAEKCDGLPLTIITVANLLLMIPKSDWIDVATKRKHQVFIDAYHVISKVLYPSFESLPQQLKLCFLYMGVFPPNYKIPRSRLINMWVVEGLLESNADKSSEECADEYLEEFSSNSLVMVYQKRIRSSLSMSIAETKSCGLHSSWWHLCHSEARKTNFFYVLISCDDRLEKSIKSQSRLSIHNNVLFAIKDVHDSMEENSASTACSLLCLGPYHQYQVPICFGLRFLKNLDALSIRLYEFPLEVLKLSGLKYLALSCDGELPTSISKLQNLQFFIVRQHHNIKLLEAPSYLPLEIWDMRELKHFEVMGNDLRDDLCDTTLPNLSTLLEVSGHSCTKNILKRIPHLKKLGIKIELPLDFVEPLCCFDHISQLNELEILKCVVVNPVEHKFEFVSLPSSSSIFPYYLKKLTLSGLGYPWEKMSSIASLSYLEVLKLRCNAFRGPRWYVDLDEFRTLKSLIIEDMDLMQWKVDHRAFKVLESVSIKHCYKLKEIYLESKVQRLDGIEIVDCDPSLENILRGALLKQQKIPGHVSVQSSWDAEDIKP